ncbi:MAG TPA: tail fiber domain-containing protein, partial [Acidovorax defluvii]|nr:tail fiber domain-containing protein [Acidovorax defluvii]
MAGTIATIPKFQFSANGVPMVGGTLDTYIAGSTTPATTWQDSALTTANTNPISLDARGECVLWLDPAVVYKFVLKNAQGVIQWTQDNISGADAHLRADLAASSGASLVGFQQAGTGTVTTTVQAKLRETVSVKDFGAVGDG